MELIHKAMEQFFDDIADDILEEKGQIGVFQLYLAFSKNICEQDIQKELEEYSGDSKFLKYLSTVRTIQTDEFDSVETQELH